MSRKVLVATVAVLYQAVGAQAQPDRIAESIDAGHPVRIAGHLRKIANLQADEGPLDPSFQMDGLILFLKPSTAQQTALNRLLLDLQDPHSPNYHQWLTPEEYASRFGLSPLDIAKIADWLEAEGFAVNQVACGRSWIVFNGTAGAVERAFQTDLRRYTAANKRHFANASNPSVPRALQDIVGAIGGLDDFLPQPVRNADWSATPAFTAANGNHFLAPDDLATIYDFASLLQMGIDGSGQKVVVVGASITYLSDVAAHLAKFNLPAPNIQAILTPNFPYPGLTGAVGESVGDLEETAAVARNATILYVYSSNAYNALIYSVDQNLAPVITASFHDGCDATETAALMSSYQGIAQQGNAQGITWVNSSGDSGAAGCDNNGVAAATQGLAARFPADIPEVTAVGGTAFNEQAGSYWSATNDANGASALSYIPEMAWNDTGVLKASWAGSGGASTFFPKPSWQTGPGVPDDGARDYPDVALTASFVHDPYLVTFNGNTGGGGGTSASAPAFAGMMVLLNHYLVASGAQDKPGLGNVNQMLYGLAQTSPGAFHDITSGDNIVPCVVGTPDCTTGSIGYAAGPGFDLATGLGSVDLANLAAAAQALSMPQ
jgi:subtilase family serine protease